MYDETGSPIGIKFRRGDYAENTYDYFFFEKNLQGDIVAIYNENGTKIGSYTYDAWGNVTVTTHTSGIEATIVNNNPFRYRGYYYDSETGWYYLQSRYYNPEWGRFINADGLLATGGFAGYNLFAYCANNPVMYIDPSGFEKEVWEQLGFKYDGSVRDFIRLNNDLPPYAYEQWLQNNCPEIEPNTVVHSDGISTIVLESVVYIPSHQTQQYYIEMSKKITEFDYIGFIIACVGLYPNISWGVSAILELIGWRSTIVTIGDKLDLWKYEAAMNDGKGVLVLTYSYESNDPDDIALNNQTSYYSWDGKSRYLN